LNFKTVSFVPFTWPTILPVTDAFEAPAPATIFFSSVWTARTWSNVILEPI